MLYADYFHKAAGLTVQQADNGLFYLDPLWKAILQENGMGVSKISDVKTTWAEMLETLKLEVTRKNTILSDKPFIEAWLYDLITQNVEPAMMQEETDYIKQVVEFMKTNHENNKDNIVPFPTKE